jgi:DNA-binding XRE family transcriptional regulator
VPISGYGHTADRYERTYLTFLAFSALNFAQRAFVNFEILALPAADIVRLRVTPLGLATFARDAPGCGSLRARMAREVRLRSEASAAKMISEMGLAELRAAMDMTQESLANALHVKQASISKMERRSDMYISTLSKIIEAMGGELQIVAKMPNGNVKIRQFTQIRQDESETASAIS